jgi:hypothetical protein
MLTVAGPQLFQVWYSWRMPDSDTFTGKSGRAVAGGVDAVVAAARSVRAAVAVRRATGLTAAAAVRRGVGSATGVASLPGSSARSR